MHTTKQILVILAFSLTACAPLATPAPTATSSPSSTPAPTQIPPTVTHTAQPTKIPASAALTLTLQPGQHLIQTPLGELLIAGSSIVDKIHDVTAGPGQKILVIIFTWPDGTNLSFENFSLEDFQTNFTHADGGMYLEGEAGSPIFGAFGGWDSEALVQCFTVPDTLKTYTLHLPGNAPIVLTPVKPSEIPYTFLSSAFNDPQATPFPEGKNIRETTADGKWLVSTHVTLHALQITSADGKTKWIVDERNLPDARLGEIFWYSKLKNDHFLYIAVGKSHYEAIIENRVHPMYGIFKLDLSTGDIIPVLEPWLLAGGGAEDSYFELSPDENRIIYSYVNGTHIAIQTIETGEATMIPLPIG